MTWFNIEEQCLTVQKSKTVSKLKNDPIRQNVPTIHNSAAFVIKEMECQIFWAKEKKTVYLIVGTDMR